jgi:hypothetical protein
VSGGWAMLGQKYGKASMAAGESQASMEP